MRAFTIERRARRIAVFVFCALGLSATGCDKPITAPTARDPGAPPSETRIQVSPGYARAGEQVRVEFRMPKTAGVDAGIYSSMSWDPAGFEYVGTEPSRLSQYLVGNPKAGWMFLPQSDASGLNVDRVTLLFVALKDTETRGFAVDQARL